MAMVVGLIDRARPADRLVQAASAAAVANTGSTPNHAASARPKPRRSITARRR
jgi:hypothetical protein